MAYRTDKRHKLTPKEVLTIRSRRRAGATLLEIATEFDRHLTTIWQIVNRKTWKNL